MAKTALATGNALTKKLWEEKLFRDTVKESYFQKFHGKTAQSIVHVKDQLTKSKGDNITFGIRMRLSGAGVEDGATLEGNEEKLSTYDFSATLKQYRHAVRDNGTLDRQRAMYDIDSESSAALQDWGTEKIDQLHFDALAATDPTRVFYRTASGNLTTATADTASGALVATTSNITPSLITFAKVWALTGGDRSQTPLRPVMIGGKKHFVLLVHPDVGYDLQQDSTWTQANREAMERGKSNPLFSGALGVWSNVIVHEHENVDIATDGGAGSNVPWAKCFMLGAQSLVWCNGMRKGIVKETFDYGEEHGYAWGITAVCAKPIFNSVDYGSVGFYVSRTQISDAS